MLEASAFFCVAVFFCIFRRAYMYDKFALLAGMLLPLVGTVIGASFVYFLSDSFKLITDQLLLGFASGVMLAAAVFSLLLPAMDMAAANGTAIWLPSVSGFLVGVAMLIAIDIFIPTELVNTEGEGCSSKRRSAILFISITLHNLPEGMAVGVSMAGMLSEKADIKAAAMLALSLGIAIQNIPEGAIISAPLRQSGLSKNKAFGVGVVSGIIEPIGALVTLLLVARITVILPYILAFAAGAMFYVVVKELIPETGHGRFSLLGSVGASVGFAVMMLFDVMLG